jgi:SfnB family sulfur acquisition oxidoreductase
MSATMSPPSVASTRRLRSASEALDAAHALAADIAPGAVARDRAGLVPRDALAALDRSGLLGITIPTDLGGAGVPAATLAEVIRIIAAADPAIAQSPQGHFLFMDILRLMGSRDLQRRLFAEVFDGARFASALAERGAADAQDLKTTLTPVGAGFVLTGRKYYCTGGLTARWIGASALADDRLFIAFVRGDDPRVTLDEDWHAMGQRATVSGAATFKRTSVERDLVLPYWRVFQGPQLIGARAQLVHAAIEVGIAGAALADAAAFLRERSRPFFEPVRRGLVTCATDDPYALIRLGRLQARVRAAEALLRDAGEQLEPLGLAPATAEEAATGSLAVAAAKAFGSDVAVETAAELFAITGTSGTDERLGLDRHWRNARTHSVHDPVDWKYHHLGAHLATGALPPNHGQI